MREAEECLVDERRYFMNQYPAGKALRMLQRVGRLIGKPMGVLFSAASEDPNARVNPEVIGKLIQEMSDAATPEEFERLCKDMLEGTTIDRNGKLDRINFDIDFQGKIGHLFRVLIKVFSFQYSDFLADIAAATPGPVATVTNRVQAR